MTLETLIADVVRATAALTSSLDRILVVERAIARHGQITGDVGELLVEQIPFGWVTVSYLDPDQYAEPSEYFGPAVWEDDTYIHLSVGGDVVVFSKNRVIVTRSTHPVPKAEGDS